MDTNLRTTIKKSFEDWQNRPFPKLYPRTFKYDIVPQDFQNILAIIGPRRAGKTYSMYQIMEDLIAIHQIEKTDILFLDFEDYRLLELQTKDIGEIFSIFRELYGKEPTYLCFDEIQNLEHWGRVLRTFHNEKYKIMVSGSSSKLLLTEIGTELRGRYTHRLMLPFSFQELVKKANIDVKNVEYRAEVGEILKLFNDYMLYGGFPEIVEQNDVYKKQEQLQMYYMTVFYRDLVERYMIREKQALEYLMKYSLNLFSSLFSLSKFEKYLKTQGLSTTKATLSTYMTYLKEAFFVIECAKFSRSSKVQIVNPKKIYLIDSGFIKLGTNYSENKGKILENIVAIELFRQEQEFYYFQDKGECDFVVKNTFGLEVIQAIQVTRELDFSTRDREIGGLVQAMEQCQLKEGYILTYNQEEELEEDGFTIYVLPVWKWLLKKM